MQHCAFSCLLAVAVFTAPGSARAAPTDNDEEEDIIIIIEDDDDEAVASTVGTDVADDEIIIVDDSEDELLIIEDEPEDGPGTSSDRDPDDGDGLGLAIPTIDGALGGLWEAWHVAFDSELSLGAQPLDPKDGPLRALGSVRVESWILPAPNLSFFANGFARLAIDSTQALPTGAAFFDVNEAFAKINLGVGAIQLGRLVLPWGRTQVAALGDRLNPPDHRRGPSFPDAVRAKQPQYGVSLRSSLGEVSFEGVALVAYEPTEGSIAASDQGGVRPGIYQGALIRSPARAGGIGDGDSRANFVAPADPILSTTFAARARRRVGDIDVGVSVVWGMDETPSLNLRPEVARYLARDALQEQGVAFDALPPNPCALTAARCLAPGALFHERTASAVLNLEWGLGIVILKSELLAQPDLGMWGVPGVRGKTSLLVSEEGLQSSGLSHYAASLAAEAGFGEWVVGSVEVFDRVWLGVPANQHLWGVEILDANASNERIVNRLAVGANMSGTLFDQAVSWNVRGEGGVLQPDLLVHTEIRYRLPVFDLYVGGRGQAFVGVPGSPGWMRQDASSIALFVGEGR